MSAIEIRWVSNRTCRERTSRPGDRSLQKDAVSNSMEYTRIGRLQLPDSSGASDGLQHLDFESVFRIMNRHNDGLRRSIAQALFLKEPHDNAAHDNEHRQIEQEGEAYSPPLLVTYLFAGEG